MWLPYDDVGEWGAGGNNVRGARHHCERDDHMGAAHPHLGRWETWTHQMNYGGKEKCCILCESLAVFQRTGSGPGRGAGLP